jgi:hypothetical protein
MLVNRPFTNNGKTAIEVKAFSVLDLETSRNLRMLSVKCRYDTAAQIKLIKCLNTTNNSTIQVPFMFGLAHFFR